MKKLLFLSALVLAITGGLQFAGVEPALAALGGLAAVSCVLSVLIPAQDFTLLGGVSYVAAASAKNAALDKIRIAFAGTGVAEVDITTADLQVDQIIKDNSGTYIFDFRANRGTPPNVNIITDILLDQNNVFVPYQVGFFIAGVDQAIPSCVREQTYPNNQVFATEAGATTYQMYSIYNGQLVFNVGKTTVPPINTSNFLFFPELEQTSAVTVSQKDQESGYYWLSELPFFFGSAKQNIQLNFTVPAAADIAADTAAWDTRIRMKLRGFVVYNGIDYVSKSDILRALMPSAK